MDYKAIYYYNENDNVVFIDDESDVLKTVNKYNSNWRQNKYHAFRMFEDYENTHDDLIRFKKDFNNWVNEIKTVKIQVGRKKKYYYLDYKKYYNHNDAVYFYFTSKLCKEKLDLFESISEDEFYIFERCLNSGLMCLNLDYKNKPTQCYGYDFSRYYTHLLLSLRIPMSRGQKVMIKDLNFDNLDFGIYRVKIEYTNKDFTNIFNFSSQNHYTSSTLSYLNKVKDKYGLTLTLLTDMDYDYNALIYKNEDLILGKTLFNDWFKSLEKIREQYPKNKLVKHLMSSLWGTLSSFKKHKISEDDIINYDADYLDDPEPSEYKIIKHTDNHYVAVKSSDAYNYTLARIKPFLTAFGRLKIMKFLHSCNIDKNIIRIHTDGLVFNRQIDFTTYKIDYFPRHEAKTTGLITYKNALYGYHICQSCKNEFRFKEFICHKC